MCSVSPIGETVPDREPFVFVWLKRDDVSVFLNDIKAAAHDYPEAAEARRRAALRRCSSS